MGMGAGGLGDVTLARTSFANPVQDYDRRREGNQRCLLGHLAQAGPTCAESPIESRSAATRDARSWTRQAMAACKPSGDVSCQTRQVDFACQKSRLGVAGQKIGCGLATKP